MNMKASKTLIAVDDGYDETKVYSAERGGLKIRSLYALRPTDVANLGLRDMEREGVYEIDGKRYAAGEVRHPEETRYDGYPYSPGNLAITIHALRLHGAKGDVRVVCGMPMSRYYDAEGRRREEAVSHKRTAWMKDVTGYEANGQALTDEEMPRIVGVSVVSEAVAAWFDQVVDDRGDVLERRLQEQIAVVDIGGRTTDVAVVQDAEVLMANSGTTDHGVLDVYGAINRRIQSDLGLTRPIPRQRIVEGLETGVVRVGTHEMDIRAVRAEEQRLLVERIQVFVTTLLGSEAALIDRVVFVGGGAMMLSRELNDLYPNMEIAPEAQYANARGMLKYGMLVLGECDEEGGAG